jgi:hypothetical protein
MLINGFPFAISSLFLRKRASMALFQPIDALDLGGRPLAEGRSRSFPISTGDLSPCKYSDSRGDKGKSMNVGALRRFLEDYDGIMEKTRNLCLAAEINCGLSSSPDASLLDLWKVFASSKALPLIEMLRASDIDTPPKPLPLIDSSFYKFSLGILDILSYAFRTGFEVGDKLSGEEMYLLADHGNRLVGEQEVCPASSAQIIKVMNRVLTEISNSKLSRRNSDVSSRDVEIIRVSHVLWILQRTAMIYETLRCFFFLKQQLILDNSRREYQCRYTIPHFRIAMEAARENLPLDHHDLKAFLAPAWSLKEQTPLCKMFDQFNAMSQYIHRFTDNSIEGQISLAEKWQQLSKHTADLFSASDVELKSVLNLSAAPHLYMDRDIEVFFGESPFRKNS